MANKYKVIIFGCTSQAEIIERTLDKRNTVITAYLDSNGEKQGTQSESGVTIHSPSDISNLEYDYIIISLLKRVKQVRMQLESLGVKETSIVDFYFQKEKEQYSHMFYVRKWEVLASLEELKSQLSDLAEAKILWENNCLYELSDCLRKRVFRFPQIIGFNESVKKMTEQRASVCRYGDAEFSIMKGKMTAAYQKPDMHLAERLYQILDSPNERVIVGIPNMFGSLQQYTEDTAREIRRYLSEEVRHHIENSLNYDRVYCDAYMFRPYIIHKDKTGAAQRFASIRQIWDGKDVVIVEGSQTRMGVGNDLLENCKSIQRIICPAEHAFGCYQDILNESMKMKKNKLFLISLGPAATVLAYDLAMAGYQAIDIGQVDIEYEWYRKNAVERMDIPHKYVYEVCGGRIASECLDEAYQMQIVVRI